MGKAKFKIGDKVRIMDGSKIENYTGDWAVGKKRNECAYWRRTYY